MSEVKHFLYMYIAYICILLVLDSNSSLLFLLKLSYFIKHFIPYIVFINKTFYLVTLVTIKKGKPCALISCIKGLHCYILNFLS